METYADDNTGPLIVEGRDSGYFLFLKFFFYLYVVPVLIVNLGECCKVGLNKYEKERKEQH